MTTSVGAGKEYYVQSDEDVVDFEYDEPTPHVSGRINHAREPIRGSNGETIRHGDGNSRRILRRDNSPPPPRMSSMGIRRDVSPSRILRRDAVSPSRRGRSPVEFRREGPPERMGGGGRSPPRPFNNSGMMVGRGVRPHSPPPPPRSGPNRNVRPYSPPRALDRKSPPSRRAYSPPRPPYLRSPSPNRKRLRSPSPRYDSRPGGRPIPRRLSPGPVQRHASPPRSNFVRSPPPRPETINAHYGERRDYDMNYSRVVPRPSSSDNFHRKREEYLGPRYEEGRERIRLPLCDESPSRQSSRRYQEKLLEYEAGPRREYYTARHDRRGDIMESGGGASSRQSVIEIDDEQQPPLRKERSPSPRRDYSPPRRVVERRIPSRDEEGEIEHIKPKYTPVGHDVAPSRTSRVDLTQGAPILLETLIGAGLSRFFIARCNYYDIFVKTKRSSIWRAPEYVVDRIRKANNTADHVILLFTVHQTQYFQGVAVVDKTRPVEHPSGSERLARVPLCWLYITDLPFYVLPHIPGLIDRQNSVKESFEVPLEYSEKLVILFERFSRNMSRAFSTEVPGSEEAEEEVKVEGPALAERPNEEQEGMDDDHNNNNNQVDDPTPEELTAPQSTLAIDDSDVVVDATATTPAQA